MLYAECIVLEITTINFACLINLHVAMWLEDVKSSFRVKTVATISDNW